ncbi:hypothetical protein MTO96_040394 [Rhipicephalus appendiculatus]
MPPSFTRSRDENTSDAIPRVFVIPARMRRNFSRVPAEVCGRNIPAAARDPSKDIGHLCHGAAQTITRAPCTWLRSSSKLPTPSSVYDC